MTLPITVTKGVVGNCEVVKTSSIPSVNSTAKMGLAIPKIAPIIITIKKILRILFLLKNIKIV
jgi:hypothetical protein